MKIKFLSTLACTAVLAFAAGAGNPDRAAVDAAPPGAAACTALAAAQFVTVTALSTAYEAGSTTQPPHCAVRGSAAPRTGADGKPYETRFELRLPTTWSGRFLYQGGGGNDGTVAPAVGRNTGSFPDTGLQRGFAVVTTDTGHQGVTAEFGVDPVARVDHAYAAHERTYTIAMAIQSRYYGRAPDHKYFVGCSGGGRQGMMFAQRYPTYFDGIAICAPAMSVSSGATIAAAWDTQTYFSAAPADANGQRVLSRAFSDADLALVARGITAVCDAADGAADGMVLRPEACRCDPKTLLCAGAKDTNCLTSAPSRIEASARPGTMYFPGRTRPLCAYPAHARYSGTGNLEDGANFTCVASSDSAPAGAASPVRGIFNWIHSTGNAERGFTFYRDVFGIELARSPFAGGAPAGTPPEPIRPAAQAGSDPLVWDLTNTHGSRFRTVFMRTPNTPFGLELSEFFDIARGDRAANPWDPGASALIFSVRDLDAVAGRLKARGAPVVTLGGAAVTTPGGRAVLVRDPDGYLIEARQAPPAAVSKATAPGDVIETSIDITVASRERAREFYEKLLGFTIKGTRTASAAELRLHGLAAGTLTETAMSIPGTAVTVVLSEFALPAGTTRPARRFDWRLQDVGSPQFQLEVSGLDALIDRTKNAGYRFLSVGAKPIQRAFGRFVFAIDPDAVLVEFVEPAASAR